MKRNKRRRKCPFSPLTLLAALLLSAAEYFECGVPGELPEVADGDAPHREGGCPAQAWSGSEFFRVYELLK